MEIWKKINSSKRNLVLLVVVFLFFIAYTLSVFQFGMFIGFKKAHFFDRFGEDYRKDFIPGGHGAVGKIINLSLPYITISSPDNLEKIVLIKQDTEIRKFRDELKKEDLKVDDIVAVIGIPNDKKEIEAKVIRLMPKHENK